LVLAILTWYLGCSLGEVQQAGNAPGAAAGGAASGVTEGTGGSGTLGGGGSQRPGAGGSSAQGAGGSSGEPADDSGSSAGAAGQATTGSGGAGGDAGDNGTPPLPSSNRIDVNIDAGWRFNKGDVTGAEQTAFNDTAWASISVPHTWNNLDGQDGPTTTPAYYRGIGWYRRHYVFPADTMSNKKIYLQFDGSAYITDVWVNGTKVGSHAGGYAAFRFDVTSVARLGSDNVIAARVDNSQSVNTSFVPVAGASTANVPPRSGDFTFFGGCYRDVHVLATDLLAISPVDYASSGVYLKTSNVGADAADLSATIKLSNANATAKSASVELTVRDAAGAAVQTIAGTQNVPANGTAQLVLTGKVTNPHLWNGLADPYLYHANVVVKDGDAVTDAVQQPLGFRFFAFDTNTGFSLNGRPYPLHGVCMHQDHKGKGGTFSTSDIDDDFAIIKELGATNIRFAHYQHSQYTYDKADQLGIVGWAENALVDSINDTAEFAANAKQQTIELIRQNYNHPSIFIWSISNEILLRTSTPAPGSTSADVIGLVRAINDLVHSEDSTRITAQAAANGDNPLNLVPDLTTWNEYNGWYYGFVRDFGPWADREHAANPTRPIGVAEYGAGASILQQDLPIVETGTSRTNGIQTEQYGTFFHESHWAQIQARPFLVWTSVWNLFDFASDYRSEGLVPGLNTKGLVTYDRQTKKDAFYLYKANWSKDPFVHIINRRLTNLPAKSTEIRVYSNQPDVEITLNGTSLGRKTASDHVFSWTNVPWASGSNTVTAMPTSGLGSADTVTFTK